MSVEEPIATVRRAMTKRSCQGYRCREVAFWNRWAGFYCTDHAIRAGWIVGPVQRPGDQLRLT